MATTDVPLSIDIHLGTDEVTLALCGDLDMATVPLLLSEAETVDQCRVMTLDLADLSFIDSAGIGYLVNLHGRLARDQRKLRLVHPTAHVRQVLDIIGVDGLFGLA